jgi:hypothetical protein
MLLYVWEFSSHNKIESHLLLLHQCGGCLLRLQVALLAEHSMLLKQLGVARGHVRQARLERLVLQLGIVQLPCLKTRFCLNLWYSQC